MHSRTIVLSLALAVMAATNGRPAQASDPVAETLYQDGKRAAEAHDWATACHKFKESHEREPAPGTLLNLADCEEKLGRLIDAMAHFDTAAALFRPGDERVAYAKERSGGVKAHIPKLVLRIASGSPPGTSVERDGQPQGPATLGAPSLTDPGEHTIIVRAPGRSDVRSTVVIAQGETRELELSVGAPVAVALVPLIVRPSSASNPAPPVSGTPTMRTLAWLSAGVAGAGLGVGVVGGILTMNAKSTANAHCSAAACNDSTGLDAESRGKTWSAVSTTGFIVAGAGIASAVTLFVVAPRRSASSALIVEPWVGGAGVRWSARF